MAHYGKNSRSAPAIVVREAVNFFGSEGLGLPIKEEIKDKNECCASFECGDGHIFVKACKKEKGSEVEVETHRWDDHVQQFLEKI